MRARVHVLRADLLHQLGGDQLTDETTAVNAAFEVSASEVITASRPSPGGPADQLVQRVHGRFPGRAPGWCRGPWLIRRASHRARPG